MAELASGVRPYGAPLAYDVVIALAKVADAAREMLNNCFLCDGEGVWRGTNPEPCPRCQPLRDALARLKEAEEAQDAR